eukprot:scaffold7961_cov73-Skeletonema_dohrnii-CCMP3373.AAC.5
MKFISQLLILILALIVNSSAAQTVDGTIQKRNKCFADCRQMLKDEVVGTMCAPAVNVHPIPLVFQACKDGERSAFKQACFARCAASAETVPFDKTSSYEACIKHKKGLRLKFVWCRQGYDFNRKRLSSVVSSNIVEEEAVKELADGGEAALNHHHHNISRALDHEEVDRMMETQLQRKEHTFQVASKGREIIELGSTVPDQETELGLLHSQQTQFGVLSTQEQKHLQHGVVSFEAIALVDSELSLVDVLPRKSLELDKPSLPATSNVNVPNDYRLILLPWADSLFLDTSASVTECTDFYTSRLSCNHARGIKFRGINLDTILLTPMGKVSKDNVDVWKYASTSSTRIRFESTGPSSQFVINQDNLGKYPHRAKTKVLEACTDVLHVVESSNTSQAHVAYTVENDSLGKSLNYEGFELGTTFRIWSLADNLSFESSSITTRSHLDKIDPVQLTFRELLHHVWSAQVPFDKLVERKRIQRFRCRSEVLLLLDSPSQGIMSSDGILHQSIHSLRLSRVYLIQDMSSFMLTNVSFCPCVSDRDLLLDKCNMPPRLDAIFVTAVNRGVRSQSKQLCNPVNEEELDVWGIQEDAIHLEHVFSNHINSHKEEIGGIDVISMSFSSCHFELTQNHCTWKALRRKDAEGCRDDCHAQPRGVFINCIDINSLELCILHSTSIHISYDSFAIRQVRLRKHPYWAKFKFKELYAPHTSAARPSTSISKAVLLGNETAKGFEWSAFSGGYKFQSPSDHGQRIGFKQHRIEIDPLMPESSSIAADADAAVSTLQLSFGVSPHVWPMHCRLKSVDPLRIVCLSLSISSEHVISSQAGGNGNSHLDVDVLQARHPSSTEAIAIAFATLLLLIYCYCCSCATRPLDSVIVDHGIIVEAPGEIVIEWKFRRRQQQELLCIALASIDTCWKDAWKIQLATKALRSKLELSGLNCSCHRGRSRRLQEPGRLKPP